jgi:hypothetical protein
LKSNPALFGRSLWEMGQESSSLCLICDGSQFIRSRRLLHTNLTSTCLEGTGAWGKPQKFLGEMIARTNQRLRSMAGGVLSAATWAW